MNDEVHLAIKNPTTGRYGSYETPTHLLRVACAPREIWARRPRRTLRPDLITCTACKEAIVQ